MQRLAGLASHVPPRPLRSRLVFYQRRSLSKSRTRQWSRFNLDDYPNRLTVGRPTSTRTDVQVSLSTFFLSFRMLPNS